MAELTSGQDDLIRDRIDYQIANCPFGNAHLEKTKEWLEELWVLLANSPLFEMPADIQILGINPTFKIVFNDRKPVKAVLTADYQWDYLVALYEELVPVCEPIAIVRASNANTFREGYWCFVSWIEGECYRTELIGTEGLKKLPADLWFKLGVVLASVHSVPAQKKGFYYTSYDIAWWNYVVDPTENVWLTDMKKIQVDQFPERWIYFHIFFHQHITFEQKKAFIAGYASVEPAKRTDQGMEMLESARLFTDMLHERLAKKS